MSITLTVQQASTLARLAAESPDDAVTLHELGGARGTPHDVYAAPAGAREPQVCITPAGEVEPIEPRGERGHFQATSS
ncbi:MAG TPA: hypothetical protein VFS37_06725 [Conexibacter sp.]|nr:hypothetical protein [Conexibacter sp.]